MITIDKNDKDSGETLRDEALTTNCKLQLRAFIWAINHRIICLTARGQRFYKILVCKNVNDEYKLKY